MIISSGWMVHSYVSDKVLSCNKKIKKSEKIEV